MLIGVVSQDFLWGLGIQVWLTFHICCGAKPNHLHYLSALFLCFKVVPGLKINLAKSKMGLVGFVENVNGLVDILGCGVSSLHLKHLGLPLGASYKAKPISDGVIEKIELRLASWKMKYLCKGGRVTLVKSTLSYFPTYLLSLFSLHVGVANCIEKFLQDCLWGVLGEDAEEFKFHFLSWSKVCSQISEGGLEVRNLLKVNRALLER